MTSSMDISFIDRTLKTTGVLALIVLAFGWLHYPFYHILAVFSGMIWGIINLYFLALLVRAAIRPDGADKMAALGLMFIKFPMLYVAGYFLLKVPQFELAYLVIGFSSLFAVMLLKVLGRVILGLDGNNKHNHNQQQQEAV